MIIKFFEKEKIDKVGLDFYLVYGDNEGQKEDILKCVLKNYNGLTNKYDEKEFLESKRHTLPGCGFDPVFYPEIAFDFQKEIINRATKKGRIAIFADTGLGKTLMQISIAQNFVQYTNKKVLIQIFFINIIDTLSIFISIMKHYNY